MDTRKTWTWQGRRIVRQSLQKPIMQLYLLSWKKNQRVCHIQGNVIQVPLLFWQPWILVEVPQPVWSQNLLEIQRSHSEAPLVSLTGIFLFADTCWTSRFCYSFNNHFTKSRMKTHLWIGITCWPMPSLLKPEKTVASWAI